MTPGARLAAAMAILDDFLAGAPAERSLTRWARASRYAGSKDRAAVRDLVFDTLRRRRSCFWRSGQGQETGRALITGLLADYGSGFEALGGSAHASPQLSDAEAAALRPLEAAPEAVRLDCPDALLPLFKEALGGEYAASLAALRHRAIPQLRVNTLKATRAEAIEALSEEDIATRATTGCATALDVLTNPRRIAASEAYRTGRVELQDAASQIAAAAAQARPGQSVLDFCAGGGGKTLALGAAMEGQGRLVAHDANPARMKDLPARAARAGLTVECLPPGAITGSFDLVFVDAPCSGSGAWRRQPEGKWIMTRDKLAGLASLQARVLADAARFLAPKGRLIYATCSVFPLENQAVVEAFQHAHPGVSVCSNTTL
ncbi:MAG: RsmB/NOP family class I SAM-dependent RNA methyltransferase, partial [Pseudomonadota bacterium]